MKRFFYTCRLFQKRLWKRPIYLLTFLLLPVMVLLLGRFSADKSTMVEIPVYAEDSALLELLLQTDSSLISFYSCPSLEAVREAVTSDQASCGYVIPKGSEMAFLAYYQTGKRIPTSKRLTVYLKERSVTTTVVNEMVMGKIFSLYAPQVSLGFLEAEQPERMKEPSSLPAFTKFYQRNHSGQMVFDFQYADGSENQLMADSDVNYYMMPVRGMLAVLLLAASLIGGLYLQQDDEKGVWGLIPLNKRNWFDGFYLYLSQFLLGIGCLAAIFCTGLSANPLWECLLLFVYSILITAFTHFIKTLLPNPYTLCATIPILLLLCLFLCPVFVDIGNLVSVVPIARLFLPVSYYLKGVHEPAMIWAMLLFAGILILLRLGIKRGKEGKIR